MPIAAWKACTNPRQVLALLTAAESHREERACAARARASSCGYWHGGAAGPASSHRAHELHTPCGSPYRVAKIALRRRAHDWPPCACDCSAKPRSRRDRFGAAAAHTFSCARGRWRGATVTDDVPVRLRRLADVPRGGAACAALAAHTCSCCAFCACSAHNACPSPLAALTTTSAAPRGQECARRWPRAAAAPAPYSMPAALAGTCWLNFPRASVSAEA